MREADAFTPLGAWLAGAAAVPDAAPESVAVSYLADDSPAAAPARAYAHDDLADAMRDARLFRAALADAVEALAAGVIRRLAVDVLARELRAADVDVAALARRLVDERLAEEPLVLRLAPADVARGVTAGEVPVEADPALVPGDAVLVCRTGSIDARLGVRLQRVLAEELA